MFILETVLGVGYHRIIATSGLAAAPYTLQVIPNKRRFLSDVT